MSKDRGLYKRGKTWCIRYKHQGVLHREAVSESKTEAKGVLAARKTQIREGKFFDMRRRTKNIKWITFKEKVLDWVKNNRPESTYRYYCRALDNFTPFAGNKALCQINPFDLEKFKNNRRKSISQRFKRPVSASTINRELACLKHSFALAIVWKFTNENPVKQVQFFKESSGRLRYLEIHEIDKLLNACEYEPPKIPRPKIIREPILVLREIVELDIHTGLRKNELLNLKWDDFKEAGNDLSFLIVRNTKNGEERILPLDKRSVEIIKSLPKVPGNEFIFASPDRPGQPIKDIKRTFRKALKKAHIEDFRFHDLRHTFASHFQMATNDERTLRELLGHKTMTMTKRYAHLSLKHKKEGVDTLNERLNESSTKVTQVSS